MTTDNADQLAANRRAAEELTEWQPPIVAPERRIIADLTEDGDDDGLS